MQAADHLPVPDASPSQLIEIAALGHQYIARPKLEATCLRRKDYRFLDLSQVKVSVLDIRNPQIGPGFRKVLRVFLAERHACLNGSASPESGECPMPRDIRNPVDARGLEGCGGIKTDSRGSVGGQTADRGPGNQSRAFLLKPVDQFTLLPDEGINLHNLGIEKGGNFGLLCAGWTRKPIATEFLSCQVVDDVGISLAFKDTGACCEHQGVEHESCAFGRVE